MTDRKLTLVVETARLQAPVVFGHGGAGSVSGDPARIPERSAFILQHARESIARINEAGAAASGADGSVCRAVLQLIEAMENDPRFNAGLGSKLQRDGRIRTSAALMDGRRTRMSAIYNAESCLHPAALCAHLLELGDRNLDGLGAANLMAELGIAPQNLETPERRAEHEKYLTGGQTGTIGVVAVGPRSDTGGETWACTSTGGRGNEVAGRVSDSPTPAGNYACPQVATSTTGIGEQILDLNLAGRLATRMVDGMSLGDAMTRTMEEAHAAGAFIGLIAVAPDGEVAWGRTTPVMPVAGIDGAGTEVHAI